MAAFTTLTDGFTPNAHLAELITACNERRLAAIYSGLDAEYDAIPSSDVGSFQGGSVKPIHRLMQDMLLWMYPKFINYKLSYDNNTASKPLPNFTFESWCEAAGLTDGEGNYGFRRATAWEDTSTDPEFTYGTIQTGDIAGYWIWDDLVKGIRALKWTDGGGDSGTYQSKLLSFSPPPYWGYATEEEAREAANANYTNTAWSSYGTERPTRRMSLELIRSFEFGPEYTWTGSVHRSKILVAPYAPLAGTCVFVIRPTSSNPDYYLPLEGLDRSVWVNYATGTFDADDEPLDLGWTIPDSASQWDPYSVEYMPEISEPDYGIHHVYSCEMNYVVIFKWDFEYK